MKLLGQACLGRQAKSVNAPLLDKSSIEILVKQTLFARWFSFFFSSGKVRATSFVRQTLSHALGWQNLILPDQIIFSEKRIFFFFFLIVKHYSSALANIESTFHASKLKDRYKINMYI